ncbi:MAG: hypothetical protein ACI85I_000949 [Arenicella sp.]|jgi:hypothetical protein
MDFSNSQSIFKKITHPNYKNGLWEKGPYSEGTNSIFNGNFTENGFLTIQPNQEIDEQAQVQKAIEFSKSACKILLDGSCYSAFGSESDLNWQPFVLANKAETFGQALTSIFSIIPADVVEAYQKNRIYQSHPIKIVQEEVTTRDNVFWENGNKPAIDSNQIEAFKKVSGLLKNELEQVWEIKAFPDYIEFPLLFIGKHKQSGLFCGMITPIVWT